MTRSRRLIPPIAVGLLFGALSVAAHAVEPAAARTTTAKPNVARQTVPRTQPTPPPTPARALATSVQTARAGDALLGRDKADAERCIECHGVDGQGAGHSVGSEAKFPKLAGQQQDYLYKQLLDFRSGARRHDVMAVMARSVEIEDLRDIVAYFSSRSAMAGDGSGDNLVGRTLYLEGDTARGIVACAACHAPDGRGAATGSAVAPALGGQEWLYLERQLLDWRAGWRKNSALGAMTDATQRLSDGEIKNLASYLAGLRQPASR